MLLDRRLEPLIFSLQCFHLGLRLLLERDQGSEIGRLRQFCGHSTTVVLQFQKGICQSPVFFAQRVEFYLQGCGLLPGRQAGARLSCQHLLALLASFHQYLGDPIQFTGEIALVFGGPLAA